MASGHVNVAFSSGKPALGWGDTGVIDYEVRPGPGKVLAWGMDDTRLHDDLLVSAALVAALDEADWRPRVARGTTGA